MNRRREQVREVDYFGFDPISTDEVTETNSYDISRCDTSNMRRTSSHFVARESPVDEMKPHGVPTSRHREYKSSSSSSKFSNKDNTRTTQDFWGFDPVDDPSQNRADFRQLGSQQNHDNKNPMENRR